MSTGPFKWRAISHVLALLSALALCSALPAAASAQTFKRDTIRASESLRIGTFNAFILTPVFDQNFDTTQNVERAKKIAQAICDAPFKHDVIALNEVWDEEAKDEIRTKLLGKDCANRFSGSIPRVTNSWFADFEGEDSGLMIFSKLPFKSFPWGTTGQTGGATGEPFAIRDSSGTRVGLFAPFDRDCAGIDCRSDKGAAIVRLGRKGTAREYYVAFTHMNANDDNASAKAREHQLSTIRSLITEVPEGKRTRNPTFLLGDLNVRGEQVAKPSEWNTKLGPGSSFGFDGSPPTDGRQLADAWHHDQPRAKSSSQSPLDPGLTDGSGRERLDYVMPSNPKPSELRNRYCSQHSTNSFDGLSDHLGVDLDFNLFAPQCSPRKARAISIKPGAVGEFTAPDKPALHYPGAIQWWRIDTPGAYSIGFTKGPGMKQGKCVDATKCLKFEVYKASNMTAPLRDFAGQTEQVKIKRDLVTLTKYALPEPPLLIKVFSPRRSEAAGRYDLVALRSLCTSAENACPTRPAHWLNPFAGFAAVTPVVNGEDRAWFELITKRASSGKPQDLGFDVALGDGDKGAPVAVAADVRRKSDGKVIASAQGPTPLRMTIAGFAGGENLYMTVVRTDASPKSKRQYKVRWTTNLTKIVPVGARGPYVHVKDETGAGALGEDEIQIRAKTDFEPAITFDCPDVNTFTTMALPELQDLSWTIQFNMQVEEDDDDFEAVGAVGETLAQLAPEDKGKTIKELLNVGSGEYVVNYGLAHDDETVDPNGDDDDECTPLPKAVTTSVKARAANTSVEKLPALAATAQDLAGTQIAFSVLTEAPGSGGFDLGLIKGSPIAVPAPLVSTARVDSGAAISPDGKQVVFSTSAPGASGLKTTPTGGGPAKTLTSGFFDANPAWSPNGRKVVFRRSSAGGPGDLFTIDVAGAGKPKRLTRTPNDEASPSYAPDGRRIVYATSDKERRPGGLVVADLEQRLAPKRISLSGIGGKAITSGFVASSPEWAPTGNAIAFTRGLPDGESEIWTVDASTGKLRRLTFSKGQDRDPSWSPDGTRIVFASTRGAGFALHTMRADGGDQLRLTDPQVQRLAPDWGKAG